MNTAWFVLYCNVRSEQKACENLTKQGFDAYWPVRIEQRIRRHTKAKHEVTLPLFPRYIFVRQFPIEDHLSWFMIRKTDGIESALYRNGSPALVPGPVIADLRQAEQSGAFNQMIPDRSALKTGQSVRIMAGPFEGHLATVQSVLPGTTARVLMKLFGSTRPAHVPIDALRLVA